MEYRRRALTLLAWLILASWSADAQLAPAGNLKPEGKTQAPVSRVAPDAPVITIHGVCGNVPWSIAQPAATSNVAGDCKAVIVRSEFEKLSRVISPNQSPEANSQLAHFYSDQLLLAEKAHQLGLDKDPHFDDILKFTYLQVLARAMNDRLQEKASAAADAEFEKYYQSHPEEFEQATLLQISIPKQKQHDAESPSAAPVKVDAAADEAAMKAEAEAIHLRAVAGEDFEKLEEEAYAVAGDPSDAPLADMGEVTRADVGQFYKEIFALQPGAISKLIPGPDAWHIFKVISRQMMPPDDAKQQIMGQRLKESLDTLKNSMKLELNNSYFQTADAPQPVPESK